MINLFGKVEPAMSGSTLAPSPVRIIMRSVMFRATHATENYFIALSLADGPAGDT
jgi:hypothetical protein